MFDHLTDQQKSDIISLHQTSNCSYRAIASKVNTSYSTVQRFIKQYILHSDNTKNNKPFITPLVKILLLDIETSPTIAYTFKRRKVYLNDDNIIQEGKILCFAYKWLGDTFTQFKRLSSSEDDETQMLAELYEVLEEADIVIGHNIKQFDLPWINTRLLALGFPPLHVFKVVDTLEVARKNFKFPSNKLDSLGTYLKLGNKVSHEGLTLWIKVLADNPEAWETMKLYNIQDVDLLERVYLTLRSWDQKHPNLCNMIDDNQSHCTNCGSTNVMVTENVVYTEVSSYHEMVCNDCGKRSRQRINNKLNKCKLTGIVQ